ncbi:MAG: hypothetical protein ATN31_05680 [Candidatus Epulonipiscioides saccharophilum]|nr:MAG: hypothetical protein ATN31_05680 [Epulopiscium sp. AS2M-Bin001]
MNLSDIEAIAEQLIIIKSGQLIEFNRVDTLTEKIRGQVFETIVDDQMFTTLNLERKIDNESKKGQILKLGMSETSLLNPIVKR